MLVTEKYKGKLNSKLPCEKANVNTAGCLFS